MAIQIDAHLIKPNIPCPRYAFWDNDRISIRSAEIAHMLWNKASPHDRWFQLGQKSKYGLEIVRGKSVTSGTKGSAMRLACAATSVFYRYQTGYRFGTHYDDSVVEDPEEGTVSEYTILIYLNGEYDLDLSVARPSSTQSQSRLHPQDQQDHEKNPQVM
ncbi:hypothetical protein BGZ74_009019, partial [Mortierella antarctica]